MSKQVIYGSILYDVLLLINNIFAPIVKPLALLPKNGVFFTMLSTYTPGITVLSPWVLWVPTFIGYAPWQGHLWVMCQGSSCKGSCTKGWLKRAPRVNSCRDFIGDLCPIVSLLFLATNPHHLPQEIHTQTHRRETLQTSNLILFSSTGWGVYINIDWGNLYLFVAKISTSNAMPNSNSFLSFPYSLTANGQQIEHLKKMSSAAKIRGIYYIMVTKVTKNLNEHKQRPPQGAQVPSIYLGNANLDAHGKSTQKKEKAARRGTEAQTKRQDKKEKKMLPSRNTIYERTSIETHH